MAQVTITKDASVSVVVLEGPPPVDQSALVADLIAQVQTASAALDAAATEVQGLQASIAAANVAIGDQAEHIAALQAQLANTGNAQARIDAFRAAHDALLAA